MINDEPTRESLWDVPPACWSWPIPADVNQSDPGDALDDWQDGRCAFCGHLKRLDTDHDHIDGRVRGYLCQTCNLREAHADGRDRGMVRWRNRPATAVLGVSFRYRHPLYGLDYGELVSASDEFESSLRVVNTLAAELERRP